MSAYKSAAVFAEISKRLSPALVGQIGALYQVDVKKGSEKKTWTMDLKSGAGSISESVPSKPDVTITIEDEDFVAMMTGAANAQELFFAGKLKIGGNMAAAMKLSKLREAEGAKAAPAAPAKAAPAAPAKAAPAAPAKAAPAPAPAAPAKAAASGGASTSSGGAQFRAHGVFAELAKRLSPAHVQKVGAVYQFNITDGPNGSKQSWSVNLKSGSGSISEGAASSADATFTVGDNDFVGLMNGTANAQELFFAGKLKIAGNMAVAMKLSALSAEQSKL